MNITFTFNLKSVVSCTLEYIINVLHAMCFLMLVSMDRKSLMLILCFFFHICSFCIYILCDIYIYIYIYIYIFFFLFFIFIFFQWKTSGENSRVLPLISRMVPSANPIRTSQSFTHSGP